MRIVALAVLALSVTEVHAQEVEATKVSWKVSCHVDEMDDKRSCSMATMEFDPETEKAWAFSVIAAKGDPAIVVAGIPDFPGEGVTTIRVDKNKAISFTPLARTAAELKESRQQSKKLLDQLVKGKAVRFAWKQWPEGDHRAFMSLGGFQEAYVEFLRQLKGQGATLWVTGDNETAARVEEMKRIGLDGGRQ